MAAMLLEMNLRKKKRRGRQTVLESERARDREIEKERRRADEDKKIDGVSGRQQVTARGKDNDREIWYT